MSRRKSKRPRNLPHGLPIPHTCLTSLAHFWCSDNATLILNEDVRMWLAENDMAYEIGYTDDPELEEDQCDHCIFFEVEAHAFAFKLRWF